MRNSILFPLLFFSVLIAQPSFTATSITTSLDGARGVYTVDIDGDGDLDVVACSSLGDEECDVDQTGWVERGSSDRET